MCIKTFLRDLLPKKYQVPIKYWNDWRRGTLEEEMAILGRIVRTDDRVIDVGGNRGIYAYAFWRLGARVEVFEPNPMCANILEAWAADKPSVHVHSVALSSISGNAHLHIPIDDSGVEHDASASIENAGFAHAREQLVGLQILDSYRFEDIALVKIDVEGHEHSVINGSALTIAASKPALLVEIEQRHIAGPISEIFGNICALGYQGFFLMAGKLVPLERFELGRHQHLDNFGGAKVRYINNFLFLHRDKLASGDYAALFEDFPIK